MMLQPSPISTLFPYTTLFRSIGIVAACQPRRASAVLPAFALLPCLVPEIPRAGNRVEAPQPLDRKSTRLNSSHQIISYAVFCLKKKNVELAPEGKTSASGGDE